MPVPNVPWLCADSQNPGATHASHESFSDSTFGIPAMTMELMLLETAAALLNRKVPIIMAPHSTSCWWALRGMARVRWAIFS